MQGRSNTFVTLSTILGILCVFMNPDAQSRTEVGPIESVGFKVGTDSETAISGKSGIKQQATITKVSSNTFAMRGLEWKEGGDLPCRIQTLLRSLNDGSDTPTGWYWQECPGENWGNKKEASLDSNSRYYVRGLAVCDSKNKGNNRIKGIKVYAAKVWKTKEQIDLIKSPVAASHANCGTWKPAVYCPSGSIAHGVIIHTELETALFGGSGKSAVGFALKCAEVSWERHPVSD
ncbi:MAG: hypothetical protein MRK00_02835 [Nitrosomonas sp.]|nr:hypothetical protein [Nitrosomonas sp.]